MYDPKVLFRDREPMGLRDAPRTNETRPTVSAQSTVMFFKEPDRLSVVQALGFQNYREYLASSLWKNIRSAVVTRAEGKCELYKCGCPVTVVHHMDYDLETMRGNDLDRLIAVCDPCHDFMHRSGTMKRRRSKRRKNKRVKLLKKERNNYQRMAKAFRMKS